MRVATVLGLLLSASALLAPARASAVGVVIYRCTDAFGALTVQNDVPCPKGSKQKKQVIQAPPPMPAYRAPVRMAPVPASPLVPAPATDVASTEPNASTIADADRLPPPALFQCNTYDNDSYLSENPAPPPRCVRLQTTDMAGTADNNVGVACQMVTDQCQRIADGGACTAWKQRLRELEAGWKFARADDADAAKAEYERALKIVRDSTCGR
jgi:hypothetical protein